MSDNAFAPPRSNVEVQEGPEALWALTWKEVRKLYLASVNVRALGFLYGLGALGVIASGFIMISASSRGGAGAEGVSMGLAVFFIVLGGLYVVASWSCFSRPTWGRYLGIVLCALALLSIPFGTIVGIIGLIAYGQGARLFGPDRFLHKDVVLVYKQRKKDKK